ncbi:hypothetical protein NQ314_006615 [Rhamnusium bicolor]|uniref:Uncharacterized protein n=1 Tax=Rhamnusium bicolor TaxID=1586634 RepID=A0AAV8YZD5_9CUCU|nr:hypothetical protein NQ314_006615 [Rhamnusium bicolor]
MIKWNEHVESSKKCQRKPSLLKVLVATFWPEYLYLGINLVLMDIFIRLSQPFVLGKLLDYFRPGSSTTKTEALWYAGGIVALNAASAFFLKSLFYGCLSLWHESQGGMLCLNI